MFVRAAIVAGGVTGALRSRPSEPRRPPPEIATAATNDADVAALAAEVRSLRSEVRVLRALARPVPQPSAPAESSCDSSGAPPSREEASASLAQTIERTVGEGQRLDARLQEEARDSAWASNNEQALRRATEAALAGSKEEAITKAECRTTMCRLEVRHPDGAHVASFQTKFRTALPDAVFRASRAQNPDGSYSSVFHVLRKGEPIPRDTVTL